jgi:hypothetical protein
MANNIRVQGDQYVQSIIGATDRRAAVFKSGFDIIVNTSFEALLFDRCASWRQVLPCT